MVVAALVLLALGMYLGGHPSWMPSGLRSAFVNDSGSRLMQDVVSMLQRDYYRPLKANQLVNRGIAGAVASLNDPYSHYFDPSDYRTFENQSNPHLSGIGVDVLPDPKGLKIMGVFPGSPAARAGLVEGDLIVKVGPRPLVGHTADFDSSLIRGPAGTSVTLTIVRGGKSLRVTLKRANIVVPVATGRIVTYRGVKLGYVQLTSFTEGAGAEVRSQVQRVLRAGARGVILDLREHSGGLLDQAVAVASIFILDGTIVTTDGRAQPREVYLAKGNAIAVHQPMVVLVDNGTASASEILTSSLEADRNIPVIGQRTYGTRTILNTFPLADGSELLLGVEDARDRGDIVEHAADETVDDFQGGNVDQYALGAHGDDLAGQVLFERGGQPIMHVDLDGDEEAAPHLENGDAFHRRAAQLAGCRRQTVRSFRASAIAKASASVAFVMMPWSSTPRCTMVCAIWGRMPLMMHSAPINRAAVTVFKRCWAVSVSTVGTPVMSMMAIPEPVSTIFWRSVSMTIWVRALSRVPIIGRARMPSQSLTTGVESSSMSCCCRLISSSRDL